MVCRLCLQNSSEVLEIFNNKGQELKIAMVIGKHFWFEPKNEDPVSSHICHSCWKKVSDFHEFYKYIEKAQQLLTVEAIVKTEYKLTVCDITVENVELASNHELEENIEEQYEEPFNITSNALADDLKDQSIEKKKDEQSEVCKKPNAFRGALYSHKHRVQQYDGKYVCNICKKSYKMAKSLKEHMLKHTGLSLYRCPHCSRTFKNISNMQIHRKQKHPKEFEEFRKLIKISSRKKEIIIPTISSLSDAAKNSGELPSKHELENIEKQYEEPFNITSNVLDEENYGVIEFEKMKDDKNISAIHDDNEDESNLQDQIKDKMEILRKKIEFLTEKATTTYKGRGRPRKGEMAPLKNDRQSGGKYVCNICKKSFKIAKSLKDHMSKHSGLSSYRCLHCSRTFNHRSNMYTHRKRMHPKEFEEFRNLRKKSARSKEPIIPTILKDQSIDIVINEKKKDDKDISAIQDDNEDESHIQFQIKEKDKKRSLRKNATKFRRSTERNEVGFFTEETTTAYKQRGRPRKCDVAPLKNKSNCNEEKVAELRIYNDASGSNVATQEMSEIINRKISEYMKLKCDVCGVEFDTFGHISNHMRSVHDVRPYVKCCEKKFTERMWLYDHIKFHLNPVIYKCEKCCKVFSDKRAFTSHNIYNHQSEDTKIFQCPQCPRKFARKYILQTHKTLKHHKVLKYFCNECKRGFPFMSGLTSHTALKHGTKCDICSEVVKGQVAFKRHQQKHQGIEPKAQCDLCGLWYKHKSSLNRHKKRHTYKEQPEVCNICQKICVSREALHRHKYYVHKPKSKYECNICKKSYKIAISLKEHMARHEGISLFHCPICGKTFNAKTNMYKHRKEKHPKEYEELRKLKKVSDRSKDPIIPTISSLSDGTKKSD